MKHNALSKQLNFFRRTLVPTFCLALVLFLLPGSLLQTHAANVTVQGTVLSGTSSELLYLSTSDGTMHIKIDPGTDTSGNRILLPGTILKVTVTRGNDGYMHAVSFSAPAKQTTVTVDTSSTATVTGTLSEKSRSDLLYLNTSAGEMQLKLDPSTTLNCSILVANKNYVITCARGSDAYMHAVSISDAPASGSTSGSGTSGGNASSGPVASTQGNSSAAVVMGTVDAKTTDQILHLSTASGTMEIKIDSTTETSKGMILVPGRVLSVAVVRGSDAYMHAVATAGVKSTSSVSVGSATATVTGTVGSKSTEDILFLHTTQGDMELKLDTVTSLNNCKVLTKGKAVTVTCARGNDAYMHAFSITANPTSGTASQASSGSTSDSAASLTAPVNGHASAAVVTGTVAKGTKTNLIHLNTASGLMEIVVDGSTDSSKGMVHTPGNTLAVSVYRGSDAYMHAIAVVGVKSTAPAASVNTNALTTVAGTVNSKSNENILFLDTAQGQMELKLDAVRSVNCKSITAGRILAVNVGRGSDAYMHAVDIIGY